ncbi:MAG: hypothetical protein HY999_00815 [Nitrospinae bacterium]|nr:hypothetical protein [Nitrospinota bacterium]
MNHLLRLLGVIAIVLVLGLGTQSAFAEQKLAVGALGGWAWGLNEDGVKGLPTTHFESGGVYGANIMYLYIPDLDTEEENPYIADKLGFGVEACIENFSMDLKVEGEHKGTLKMIPVMFLFKFQGVPPQGIGFSAHADIGLGMNFAEFDKAPGQSHTRKIDVDNSLIYEIGAGTDYFFTKDIAFSMDVRFLLTEVDWEESGRGEPIISATNDLSGFQVSNVQLLVGLRYWF